MNIFINMSIRGFREGVFFFYSCILEEMRVRGYKVFLVEVSFGFRSLIGSGIVVIFGFCSRVIIIILAEETFLELCRN